MERRPSFYVLIHFLTTSRLIILLQIRVALYLIQCASEDEETQLRGLVLIIMLAKDLSGHSKSIISSNSSSSSTLQRSDSRWSIMGRILSRVFESGPMRVGMLHVCAPSDDQSMEMAKADLLDELGTKERLRSKFHNGV